MSILQFLYNLVNWQYFGILAIIWIVVDLVWIERWRSLIGRASKLISKPWIFKADEEPTDPPLYPRTLLEQLASTRRADNSGTNSNSTAGWISPWIIAQRDRVFNPQKPLRSLGIIISLALFIFFLIADAIVIANTLVLMGLIDPNLPDMLKRLDIAILGGAVLTAVVGVWMLIEMSGEGEFISTDLTSAQKKLLKLFAVIVTLFSIVVMLALAVQRLIDLGFLESSPTMSLILSFVLYGLLAINNSFSAALTFQPGISGLIVLIYLLFVVFPVLAFILDMLGRPIYIIIDIVMWVLVTPIIAIPHWIGEIIKMFTNF